MLKEKAHQLAIDIRTALCANVMEFINDNFQKIDEDGNEETTMEDSFYISKSNYDHEDLLVLRNLLLERGLKHDTEQNDLLKRFGITDNTQWFVSDDIDVSYDTEEEDLYLVISWKNIC